MPNQKNDVELNVNTRVTGKESIQQLVQLFQQLFTLISSISGKSASWLGGGPWGGTSAQHLKELLGGGYSQLGPGAQGALYADAIGQAQAHLSSAGAMPGGIAPPPPPVEMPPVSAEPPGPRPALPPGAPAAMLPPPAYSRGAQPMGGVVPPTYTGAPEPQLALPPLGGSSYKYPGSDRWGFGQPGKWSAGEPLLGKYNQLGGSLDGDLANFPLAETAKKAGSANRMLYGLLFQAFFGVLFGGLQEYTQSVQTGQTPIGGSALAAFSPAIANFAGMGVGYAMGGPIGAMAGGMIGQTGGQIARGSMEAFTQLHASNGRLAMFGGGATIEDKYGRSYQNMPWYEKWAYIQADILGYGPRPGQLLAQNSVQERLAMPLAKMGLPGDYGRSEAAMLRGEYGDRAGDIATSISKWRANPYTRDIFTPVRMKRGGYRRPYDTSGAVLAYEVGGDEALMAYNQWAQHDDISDSLPFIQKIDAASQAATAARPWGAAGAALANYGLSIGAPIAYRQGVAQQQSALQASMNELLTRIGAIQGSPGSAMEVSKLMAGVQGMQTQMLGLGLDKMKIDPRLTMQLDQIKTDLQISQLLPLDFSKGAYGLRQSPNNMTPRNLLQGMAQTLNSMLGDRQMREGETEEIIRQNWYSGVYKNNEELYRQDIRNTRQSYNSDANGIRTQLAQVYSQLESRWMERLVSMQWGMPSSMARIMRGFNYMGGSDALAAKGGQNRFFGGRMMNTFAEEFPTDPADHSNTRHINPDGGKSPAVNVFVNVANATMSDRSISDLKGRIEGWARDSSSRKVPGA